MEIVAWNIGTDNYVWYLVNRTVMQSYNSWEAVAMTKDETWD